MNEIPSVLNNILGKLNKRQAEVIISRFGLDRNEPRTLAIIGADFNITRERVRQIEASGIALLRNIFPIDKDLNAIVGEVEKIIKDMGGVISEDKLIQLCDRLNRGIDRSHLVFLAKISGRFNFSPDNEKYHPFFFSESKDFKKAEIAINKLVKYVRAKQEKISSGKSREVIEGFSRTEKIDPEAVTQYISISKIFHTNPFGDFGLAEWPEIKPQTIRDRIYLVLKKEKKPLHFREIANSINEFGLSKKIALVPTVHNELIKDSRFILVGRGMYALGEQGYEPGTAHEVIARILKQRGPLLGEEIILAVQKERFFKPNTVIANLQNKKYFIRRSDGTYQAREA